MNPDVADRRITYATLTLLTTEQGGRTGPTAGDTLYDMVKVGELHFTGRLYNVSGAPMRPGGTYEVVAALLWEEDHDLLVPGETYEYRDYRLIGHLRIADAPAD